ncbi:MAG TPA: hypothetical protein VKP30_03075 [Polyangiaceae bacterium]|nr:hypothetical protein [Polyangiaceae bacterium]
MTAIRAAAISNDPVAEQGANECLLGGGTALGAALAGFFASAGANSSVLLGPISILVAGVGSGVRAFDGRLRQPGLGVKRPRGFRDEDPVPDAAYVAVPNAMSAVAVALAYDEDRSLSSVVRYGIANAQRVGADARAEQLKVVRGMGAAAFSDPMFLRPLMHVAGPSEGGNLTPNDFSAVPTDVDVEATAHPESSDWFEVPWAAGGAAPTARDLGGQMVIIAFDTRGCAAGISYLRAKDGISLDSIELEAPRAAVPVLRGVTRFAPGERIAYPASMAIRVEAGRPTTIIASPGSPRLGQSELDGPQLSLGRANSSRLVTIGRR